MIESSYINFTQVKAGQLSPLTFWSCHVDEELFKNKWITAQTEKKHYAKNYE